MTLAQLDCFSGVAGDMWVGALLDLGLPLEELSAAVDSLGLPGVRVRAERVQRGSLAGVHFHVEGAGAEHAHRHLSDILAIIRRGDLPAAVVERVERVFHVLGEAEAAVHDIPLADVHFHEVGAVDTIVDIVCAVLGCHRLGIEEIHSSAIVTGRGLVRCEHGTLPVPAPATMRILTGMPLRSGGPQGECVTPTGAALLAVLVDEFEPAVQWTPERSGYGAGTRDDPAHPNLLRITTGARTEATRPATSLLEVACNLDTITGEGLAFLLDGSLERGAVDAFATAAQMKKGRAGWVFTALVDDAHRDAVVQFLLEESTSLGVRTTRVHRTVLERWAESRETAWGPVRFKVARLPSGDVVRRPEDDEVRRLAAEHGLSRRAVLQRLTE